LRIRFLVVRMTSVLLTASLGLLFVLAPAMAFDCRTVIVGTTTLPEASMSRALTNTVCVPRALTLTPSVPEATRVVTQLPSGIWGPPRSSR